MVLLIQFLNNFNLLIHFLLAFFNTRTSLISPYEKFLLQFSSSYQPSTINSPPPTHLAKATCTPTNTPSHQPHILPFMSGDLCKLWGWTKKRHYLHAVNDWVWLEIPPDEIKSVLSKRNNFHYDYFPRPYIRLVAFMKGIPVEEAQAV